MQVQLHYLIFPISSFKGKFVSKGDNAHSSSVLESFISYLLMKYNQSDLPICFVSFLDSCGRYFHQSKGFSIRFQSMIASSTSEI